MKTELTRKSKTVKEIKNQILAASLSKWYQGINFAHNLDNLSTVTSYLHDKNERLLLDLWDLRGTIDAVGSVRAIGSIGKTIVGSGVASTGKPISNLLHGSLALLLSIMAEVRITNNAANTLIKVVNSVRNQQPLVARPIIVSLLPVEALVVKTHLTHLSVPLAADGSLPARDLTSGELADGTPGLVSKHVHLTADDEDTLGEHVVLGKVRAEQGVAQLGALGDVGPVDHGGHGEHVVGLAGAEAAYCGLVAAEAGFGVVRDGEVTGWVESHDRGDETAGSGQLADRHCTS